MNAEQLKQAAAVMLAAAEGKPIEVAGRSTPRQWEPATSTSWNWAYCDYRVAVTKPSINWDHVHPDVVAIAVNSNGYAQAFYSMPKIQNSWWETDTCEPAYSVNAFASFVPGTCDWRDSLVVRPGVE